MTCAHDDIMMTSWCHHDVIMYTSAQTCAQVLKWPAKTAQNAYVTCIPVEWGVREVYTDMYIRMTSWCHHDDIMMSSWWHLVTCPNTTFGPLNGPAYSTHRAIRIYAVSMHTYAHMCILTHVHVHSDDMCTWWHHDDIMMSSWCHHVHLCTDMCTGAQMTR